jgi:hypothetical protein
LRIDGEFVKYRRWAKAICDILQDTWKEMTILSFYCECLDAWFVIPGEGNPTWAFAIDGDAVNLHGLLIGLEN